MTEAELESVRKFFKEPHSTHDSPNMAHSRIHLLLDEVSRLRAALDMGYRTIHEHMCIDNQCVSSCMEAWEALKGGKK